MKDVFNACLPLWIAQILSLFVFWSILESQSYSNEHNKVLFNAFKTIIVILGIGSAILALELL